MRTFIDTLSIFTVAEHKPPVLTGCSTKSIKLLWYARSKFESSCFPSFCPLLCSITVCHHWDHRNICLRWVPQVLEETQAGLHADLLCLLFHSGFSYDHRGTTQALNMHELWNFSKSSKWEIDITAVKAKSEVEMVFIVLYCCRMGCTCCSWWTRLLLPILWSSLPSLSFWEFPIFMVSILANSPFFQSQWSCLSLTTYNVDQYLELQRENDLRIIHVLKNLHQFIEKNLLKREIKLTNPKSCCFY